MIEGHTAGGKKLRAVFWAFIVLVCVLYLAQRLQQGVKFETSILALLPEDRQNPLTTRAISRWSERQGRRFVAVLAARDFPEAREAALFYSEALAASGEIRASSGRGGVRLPDRFASSRTAPVAIRCCTLDRKPHETESSFRAPSNPATLWGLWEIPKAGAWFGGHRRWSPLPMLTCLR